MCDEIPISLEDWSPIEFLPADVSEAIESPISHFHENSEQQDTR